MRAAVPVALLDLIILPFKNEKGKKKERNARTTSILLEEIREKREKELFFYV